jgi:hypothetical protein
VDTEEQSSSLKKEPPVLQDIPLSARLSLAQGMFAVEMLNAKGAPEIQGCLRANGLVPLFTFQVDGALLLLHLISIHDPKDALILGYPFDYKTDDIIQTMSILLTMTIGYDTLYSPK